MKVWILTHDQLDYDGEENPIMIGVEVIKAFDSEKKADDFLNSQSTFMNQLDKTEIEVE